MSEKPEPCTQDSNLCTNLPKPLNLPRRRARVVAENLTDRFLHSPSPCAKERSNICTNLPTPLNRAGYLHHFCIQHNVVVVRWYSPSWTAVGLILFLLGCHNFPTHRPLTGRGGPTGKRRKARGIRRPPLDTSRALAKKNAITSYKVT